MMMARYRTGESVRRRRSLLDRISDSASGRSGWIGSFSDGVSVLGKGRRPIEKCVGMEVISEVISERGLVWCVSRDIRMED
jgi:hypothetical protein